MRSPIRLRLLSEVSWDGRPLAGDRIHELLALLAAAHGKPVGQPTLIERIWSDDPPANPAKALQVLVARVRSLLEPAAVERTPAGYRLTAATDVAAVADAVAATRHAAAQGDWPAVLAATDWPSGLVVAEGGSAALDVLRQRAADQLAEARMLRGLALSALGRHAEARQLLEAAELTESVLAALLRSQAATQGVPSALIRYDEIRHDLADRLGVDPGPALQAVHAELLARDRPVREHVLFDADDLIGRDEDVAAVERELAVHRVVSIVGIGGLGKTRLAHAVARRSDAPTVCFVELAHATSSAGVDAAIADALGLGEANVRRLSTPPLGHLVDRVAAHLGSAPSLLVLDNCEQVVDAVVRLVQQLIGRTASLRVLITSRAPLGSAGERVYPLGQLAAVDAAALFVERARAARPGARLDPNEVAEVVARLDGLPLAIELAAARVRVMSVAEVSRRLSDRFELLRGGRAADERHQTMHAVIDWSWRLLDGDERTALCLLAGFPDGFTLPTAERMLGRDPVGALAGLVDQSLVFVDETEELRYRMLASVREFAERQAEPQLSERARRGMREWALGVAASHGPRLASPDQVAAVSALRAEEPAFLAVLDRALADGDEDAAVGVLAVLGMLWVIVGRGSRIEAYAPVARRLGESARVPPEHTEALRAVLIYGALSTLDRADTPPAALVARVRDLGPGEDLLLAAVARLLADDSVLTGNPGPHLLTSPDPTTALLANLWAAQEAENSGDVEGALRRIRAAIGLWRPQLGPWLGAVAHIYAASLELGRGEPASAQQHLGHAAPTLALLWAEEDQAMLRGLSALCAIGTGDLPRAERILGSGRSDHELGPEEWNEHFARAELSLGRGDIDAGLATYRRLARTPVPTDRWDDPVPIEISPWVLAVEAAAISAHSWFGRPDAVADLRDALPGKLRRVLDAQRDGHSLDHPVFGLSLYALAVAELVEVTPEGLVASLVAATRRAEHSPRANLSPGADPALGADASPSPGADLSPGADPATVDHAIHLLALADAFSYNRMVPSVAWAPAADLAERHAPGLLAATLAGYRAQAPDLRLAEAGRLLASMVEA